MRRAVLTRSTARADRRNAIAVPQWSGIFTGRTPVVLPEFAIAVLTRRRAAVRENSNDAVFQTRNGSWHQVIHMERRSRLDPHGQASNGASIFGYESAGSHTELEAGPPRAPASPMRDDAAPA